MAHEPVILGFFCNWCSYRAADSAGMSRVQHAPNLRIIRIMCSGRLEPRFVLKAFREGADGVLLGGCRLGECHYVEGNLKALQRYQLLQTMLGQFGIEEERFDLFLGSAAEGVALSTKIDTMVDTLKRLGPLGWAKDVVDSCPEVSI